MVRVKTLGLCFVVAFVLGSVAATAALAVEMSPVIKYRKKGTAEEAKVLPEGSTGTVKVAGKTVSTNKLYVPALNKTNPLIECSEAAGEATLYNNYMSSLADRGSLENGTVTFTGCKVIEESGAVSTECGVKSEGQAEGTIVASGISGHLGYKPGLTELENEEGKGVVEGAVEPTAPKAFTTIKLTNKGSCALPSEKFPVTGDVIGTVGPINEFGIIKLETKVNGGFEPEQKEIQFLCLGGTVKPPESKFGSHSAALEGKVELKDEGKRGIEEVEVGAFTKD
jgi:hypothetical protein